MHPQIHEQRLKAKCCYSDAEIRKALQDVHLYKELHQQRPGFFDTAINTGIYIVIHLIHCRSSSCIDTV